MCDGQKRMLLLMTLMLAAAIGCKRVPVSIGANREALAASPCGEPDPNDPVLGPVNLVTGCGVFADPIASLAFSSDAGDFEITLMYLDHHAASGPTRNNVGGPYPYVAGPGWTVGSVDQC